MKPFRFPLETVLKLRQIDERKALETLARISRAAGEMESDLSRLARERAGELSTLRSSLRPSPSAGLPAGPSAWVDANAYLFATSRQIERKARTLALARMQEARARAGFAVASARRKALSELRRQIQETWRRQADREEQKRIDEIALRQRSAVRGGILSALGFVLVALLALGGGGVAYLAATGKVTREKVDRVVAALRGVAGAAEPRPDAPAETQVHVPAATPTETFETPLERAKRLAVASSALTEAVREAERRARAADEEASARRQHLNHLLEELRREAEAVQKQEAVLRRRVEELESSATAGASPSSAGTPGGGGAEQLARILRKMRPAEIKEMLLAQPDAEAARLLGKLDQALAAKVIGAMIADAAARERVGRITELIRTPVLEPEGK